MSSETSRRTRLTTAVKRCAVALGFDRVGVTAVEDFVEAEAEFQRRIGAGFLEGMRWMTPARAEVACRPGRRLPWAKSIIALAVNYYPGEHGHSDRALLGLVARYAWGEDYHDVLEERLRSLVEAIAALTGQRTESAIYVDHSPLAECEAARRAGVGWFGKHTNVLVPGVGSWVLLAEVLTAAELEPDAPLKKSCGACSACLTACPTGALVAPYVLDARRCISYLTIEHDGPIPAELRPAVGTWILGCDLCQEVCPVNRHVRVTDDRAFAPGTDAGTPELLPLLELDEPAFRARFRRTAFFHAKRRRIQRNVCVALGNLRDTVAVPALSRTLLHHDDGTVRAHAAWALGQIATPDGATALEAARAQEQDESVLAEIHAALEECLAAPPFPRREGGQGG